MESCSDDVCHSTDESLVQFHRSRRTVSQALLRTIQHSSLRGNPPSASDFRHMIHRGRTAEPRGSIRTILQPQLQSNPPQSPVQPTYDSPPLASSNEMKVTPTFVNWLTGNQKENCFGAKHAENVKMSSAHRTVTSMNLC
ncbi:unnamed protein product [Protopolystoma xenopodis]|uniref:CRIB domain-containing protein n=1 Tax=Protopolystoma xenopodis TaxID=117903 RepID=A0A3S5B714_9PLAT|nr:unnamed protein product [Protopolystoma xenopodis]